MTRTLAAALFAAGILAAAPAASAAPKEVVVAYGDLDLNAAAGRSELTARLQDAAATLCSPVLANPDSELSVREHKVIYRACVGRLSQRAMARIVRN